MSPSSDLPDRDAIAAFRTPLSPSGHAPTATLGSCPRSGGPPPRPAERGRGAGSGTTRRPSVAWSETAEWPTRAHACHRQRPKSAHVAGAHLLGLQGLFQLIRTPPKPLRSARNDGVRGSSSLVGIPRGRVDPALLASTKRWPSDKAWGQRSTPSGRGCSGLVRRARVLRPRGYGPSFDAPVYCCIHPLVEEAYEPLDCERLRKRVLVGPCDVTDIPA